MQLDEIIKNKFVDKNKLNAPPLHNFFYNTYSVGMRTSIEFCEFEAALISLENIEYELKNIINNNINYNKPHILLAIDNETVLYWLLGKYKIKEGIIRDKIKKIYDKINDLNDLDIKIILS